MPESLSMQHIVAVYDGHNRLHLWPQRDDSSENTVQFLLHQSTRSAEQLVLCECLCLQSSVPGPC